MMRMIQALLCLGWTTRAAVSRSFPFAASRRLLQRQWPRRCWPSRGTVLRLQAGDVGGGGGGACWDAHYGRLDFGTGGSKVEVVQKRFLDGPKKAPGRSILEVRGVADSRVNSTTGDKTVDDSSQSSSCTSSSITTNTVIQDGPKLYHGVQRQIRRGAGGAILAAGFVLSATRALVTNGGQWKQLKPTVEAFRHFLKKSEIDLELSKSLNYRLLYNIVLLSRVQKKLVEGKDIRDSVVVTVVPRTIPTMKEGLRYMKYATAAYGDSMILAADIDAKGQHDIRPGRLTKTRVSQHIDVPENDIVLMDIDYAGDPSHLRHFVAVDHANKKVVLAIRGTFSLSELVVDAASFSSKWRERERGG
jgi:hypothetical protein